MERDKVLGGDGGIPRRVVGIGDGKGERFANPAVDPTTPQTSRDTGAIPKRALLPPSTSQWTPPLQPLASQWTPSLQPPASQRTPSAQPPGILRPIGGGASARDPYQSRWDMRESVGTDLYPRSRSTLPPTNQGREYLTPVVSVLERETTRTPLQVMSELKRKEEEERRDAELEKLASETAERVRLSLEHRRKEQRAQQGRERLRQDTEYVARLADGEVAGYNINFRGVRQDLEEQKWRQERLERRSQGETPSSGSSGEGLAGTFNHLGKVLESLNNPQFQNNPEVLERNTQHLNRVTEDRITRGLERSIEPIESMIEERISETVARLLVESEERIKNTIDRTLRRKVEDLEDRERLRVRADTEKKDAVRPLVYYPPNPAPGEVYRKAMAQMTVAVRVIERSESFQDEPFNYAMRLAEVSNKIAMDFGLDEQQQKTLILGNIPSSPTYNYMKKAADLRDLMKIISTLATSVSTGSELERKINEWIRKEEGHIH